MNIPKKIIQTWENKQLDPEFQQMLDAWKNNNPHYDYYLFDKEERIEFIKTHFDHIVLDTYNNIVPGANKADLFRYCYLYIHGGVTTDIDTLCIGKLDDFLLPNIDFVTSIDLNGLPCDGQHNLANGTIVACVPKHPIILDCINRIVYNVRNHVTFTGHLDYTGPGLLGRAVNIFLGNMETESFIGKEGIHNTIHLLKFENNTEYFKDIHGNILGQNKNGNPEIKRLYDNECKKLEQNYIDWCECPLEQVFLKPQTEKVCGAVSEAKGESNTRDRFDDLSSSRSE